MRSNNSGKMLIIIIAAILILLLAGIGVFALKGRSAKSGKVEKGPTKMLPMGELVVNLADSGETRYLKTDLVLETRGVEGGESGAEETKTRLRDAIIGILSSRHFADLVKPGGKEKLKAEIIAATTRRLKDAEGGEKSEVVGVYFNEFAMQ